MPRIFGSPKWQLWWTDAAPVLKRGAFAALATFATVALMPLLDVTQTHIPLFVIVSGAVGSGIQALIQWASDNQKA
jgi:hypothetical protein